MQLPLNEKWLRREANVLVTDLAYRKIISGSVNVLTLGEKRDAAAYFFSKISSNRR